MLFPQTRTFIRPIYNCLHSNTFKLKRLPHCALLVRNFTKGDLTPFSKSAAYMGGDRGEYVDLNQPFYIPDYYDSVQFKRIKMVSMFGSIFVLVFYLCYREPNDIDEILEAPPELFYTNMQKMVDRENMRKAMSSGNVKEARKLKAQIDYNSVIEAETRIKYQEEQEGQKKVNKGFGILDRS